MQPIGMVTIPASTPSAVKWRSDGSMLSATGMGEHNGRPHHRPVINPEYSHAATSPPASSWRKNPPISQASSVPANMDGFAPVRYTDNNRPQHMRQHRRQRGHTDHRQSQRAHRHIKPSSTGPPDPSILFAEFTEESAPTSPNCDRSSTAAISIKNIMMYT